MILEFMRDDHRACDHLYTEAENALAEKRVDEAKNLFDAFYQATNHHFDMEERELFITFEKRTGMMGGPTQMMRYEHQQLRSLLESMRLALRENRVNDFFGIGESMMIMLQQHNMKEEQMLYPMIDRTLGEDGSLMIQTLRKMEK
ncbi:hemerythrin domain-containing protein [Sulfuricurvum sp.]|uniref:hemerythrin domain-containing protein n=1 Tax=Sulfuricurvum sp. TaxID=2025608 RepID=UPI003C57FFC4